MPFRGGKGSCAPLTLSRAEARHPKTIHQILGLIVSQLHGNWRYGSLINLNALEALNPGSVMLDVQVYGCGTNIRLHKDTEIVSHFSLPW